MLPSDFLDQVKTRFGEEADAFLHALQSNPTTSIRVNTKVDLSYPDQVPWCSSGYYLPQRPEFTLDPLLHAGCYYVQEASSMFLEFMLEQLVSSEDIVLDLCAAPGGKTTLISEFLYSEGLLVSNEVVRQRVFALSENVQKWGNGNVVVTHNEAKAFGKQLPNVFDCILVDAPCSGEGMFRKDEDAIREWSLSNVEMCANRQKDILKNVWDALKPGGYLIYSTCTFNAQENEKIVHWIADQLGADILEFDVPSEWNIVNHDVGYHFYPHKTRGEGLYMCALQKYEDDFSAPRLRPVRNKALGRQTSSSMLKEWMQHPDFWVAKQNDRFAIAYPEKHKELIEYLTQTLTCVSVGFGLGEERGKQMAPQHSLSLVKDLRKDAFHNVELSKEDALNYLRMEALNIANAPLGYILINYQGVPLGFAKNVGNRCNNMYPKEWRIRTK